MVPADRTEQTMQYLRGEEREQRQVARNREEQDLRIRELQDKIQEGLESMTGYETDIVTQYADESGHKDMLSQQNLMSRALERQYNELVERKEAQALDQHQPMLPKMPRRQECGMQTVFLHMNAVGKEKHGGVASGFYVKYNDRAGILTNHHCIPSREHAEATKVYFNFNIRFDGLAARPVPFGRAEYKDCPCVSLDPNHYYTGGAAKREDEKENTNEQDKLLMFYMSSLDWAFVALAEDVSIICPETEKPIRPYDLDEALRVLEQHPHGHRARVNQELVAIHHGTGRARAMSFGRAADQKWLDRETCRDIRNAIITLANNGKEFAKEEDIEGQPVFGSSGSSGSPVFDIHGALIGLHSHSMTYSGKKIAGLDIQIDHILRSLQFAEKSSSEGLSVDTKVSVEGVKKEDIAPNFNVEEREARIRVLEDDVKSKKEQLDELKAEIQQLEDNSSSDKDDSSEAQSKEQPERIKAQIMQLRQDLKTSGLEDKLNDQESKLRRRKDDTKPIISEELLTQINKSKAVVIGHTYDSEGGWIQLKAIESEGGLEEGALLSLRPQHLTVEQGYICKEWKTEPSHIPPLGRYRRICEFRSGELTRVLDGTKMSAKAQWRLFVAMRLSQWLYGSARRHSRVTASVTASSIGLFLGYFFYNH